MKKLGVIEGFFGPEWPWVDRHSFCKKLRLLGGDFYIYAPKRDPYLRKNWTESHPQDWWSELEKLKETCAKAQVDFGVALSPFELHDHWTGEMKEALRNKVLRLQDLGIRYLGLFFDDMKGAPDLAAKQAEIVEYVRSLSRAQILFCPTYYSDDPILDKVFGARSPEYLEEIGRSLHSEIEICWTGKKVISQTIDGPELADVAKTLRRKPFIWDNYFANDGPRMCKFLKLKPFEGRTKVAFENASGWALNLMNQPALSELLFEAAALVLRTGRDADAALDSVLNDRAGSRLATTMREFKLLLNEVGLDKMEPAQQQSIVGVLDDSRIAKDIRDWLDGHFVVGPECLTD